MERPIIVADYQPSDKKVPIVYATIIKTAMNGKKGEPTHRLSTKFVLAPFEWKDTMGEAKFIDSMGCGILDGSGDLYPEDEVVSAFPINGVAYLRPCNKCKDPVVAGYEINGVRTLFFGPDDAVDGCCENLHREGEE